MSGAWHREYREELSRLQRVSGERGEGVIRSAFQRYLERHCAKRRLTLAPELRYRSPATPPAGVVPDGTVKDDLRQDRGYWEAKDTDDDLNREIATKRRKGYPMGNIIFEDSETAVLIQSGREIVRVPMSDGAKLERLLRAFLDHEPPEIADFHKAVGQFREDLPRVLEALRESIRAERQRNASFREAADAFLSTCRRTINPTVGPDDVREMLIQHMLTRDIFLKVFGEDQFHSENNIAHRLDELERTFFTGNVRRNTLDRLKSYYAAIQRAALGISDHHEKQRFLKVIYENFYKVYNPKAADRLGVVYTPGEIVKFMIRAADHLTRRHFDRHLYDRNVEILDPAAGTGTFITELIEFIPPAHLRQKYEEEIHANEVGILPYYIANLNIEYTYKSKAGEYLEFPNICFVDTLDNFDFRDGKMHTQRHLGSLSDENLERIRRQNEKRISVIIGNPPYNANQQNENENNKNRAYPAIDRRIKETYVKQSTAQKTKQYDMYKRFIRWASDRLNANGVLAFITNRSWIDSRQDDGFRKYATREFNEIHIIDLGGDIRKLPGAQNVFGIMTGVAIGLFVRKEGAEGCEIHYTKRGDFEPADDKLAFLFSTNLPEIDFEHIVPDERGNWLEQIDNDFNDLLPLADRRTKLAKNGAVEAAVFKLFSLGVVTNRDDWTYDFDKANLAKKIRFFCSFYRRERARLLKENPKNTSGWVDRTIKWTSELEEHLTKGSKLTYSGKNIAPSLYRPFVKKELYYDPIVTHRRYQQPSIFPTGKKGENRVICFSGSASFKPFQAMAVNQLPSLDLLEKTQCLPLYRYRSDGKRHSNITAWGLRQFREHYGNSRITPLQIFHYTYAVLHDPVWRERYAINLQRDFPRLPFHDDFHKWVKWGRTLANMHMNFESARSHPLKRRDCLTQPGLPKLRADKAKGIITIDSQTTLSGIPADAWRYQLGPRSALEWVLDQYKEKKIKDPTVREKFNTYRFADHKEQAIALLKKVCHISLETVQITDDMSRLPR